ncbi:carboxylesterase NlhH [Apiospora rasikravindrae]|uniref:Carboxylesterase NlhH n=1 Tax=Apiospora rasikravindrae TaxID=990691 RepID=A0ABR1TY59_9PEZI
MADYSIYGGPSEDWLAVEADVPALPTGLPPLEIQRLTNEMRSKRSKDAMVAFADKVKIRDLTIPARDGYSLEARTYLSAEADEHQKRPTYLHLHGGGFLLGTIDVDDATCSRMALDTGVLVLNLNYRHTPQYTYPTAWHDVQDAFLWIHQHIAALGGDPGRVLMGGISAGAWLTASFAMEMNRGRIERVAGLPRLAGQVLMIPPVVHPDCYEPQLRRLREGAISSYVENEFAPLLPAARGRLFSELLQVRNPQEDDTNLNPGNATVEQAKGLPPTTFGVCGLDPLRDEGLLFAKLLTEADVPTNIHVFKGLPHGFHSVGDKLKASAHWATVMHGGIKWALEQPKASGKFDVTVW